MFYLIGKTLIPCTADACRSDEKQYVAVLTTEEWERDCELFDMGIDLDLDPAEIHSTKIEVNIDSLTGTFSIPNRNDLLGEHSRFAFALDEKGIVFIDNSGTVLRIMESIRASRQWRLPCLERFLYDFLEHIINQDLPLMEGYENDLDQLEKNILDAAESDFLKKINIIRSDLRELRIHYEQLLDFVDRRTDAVMAYIGDEFIGGAFVNSTTTHRSVPEVLLNKVTGDPKIILRASKEGARLEMHSWQSMLDFTKVLEPRRDGDE